MKKPSDERTFVLMIHAEDGMHYSVHQTLAFAVAELVRQMGHPPRDGVAIDRRYRDDWGRTLIIQARDKGWTVRKERMLGEAFDARETGTASAQQIAFLEKHSV